MDLALRRRHQGWGDQPGRYPLILQRVVGLQEQPAPDTGRSRKTDLHTDGVIVVGDALFIAPYNVGLRHVLFTMI